MAIDHYQKAMSTCFQHHRCFGHLGWKTHVAGNLHVDVALVWVQCLRSSVKTGGICWIVSSVCSVIVLWVADLETALQTEFSSMFRRTSDSIKLRPNRLCLESSMQMFLDAVLSSILIVAGNSPVMWTQSPDTLCTMSKRC